MTQEWQIPRSGERCSTCSHEFEVGERYRASIHEAAAGLERRDFCLNCQSNQDAAAVGSWVTRRPEPAHRKGVSFDRESLLSFFQNLADDSDEQRRQFRFVLALLLWRQKTLKLADTVLDGDTEVWHFVEPRGAETYRVVRPDLGEAEIERLSCQLETLVTGGPELRVVPAPNELPESEATHA